MQQILQVAMAQQRTDFLDLNIVARASEFERESDRYLTRHKIVVVAFCTHHEEGCEREPTLLMHEFKLQ